MFSFAIGFVGQFFVANNMKKAHVVDGGGCEGEKGAEGAEEEDA